MWEAYSVPRSREAERWRLVPWMMTPWGVMFVLEKRRGCV